MPESVYEDQAITLHDLIEDRNSPVLKNITFRRCEILGPAVVWLQGAGTLNNVTTDEPGDAVFIQIHLDQKQIVGPIVLDTCHFYDCRFRGVGIIDRNHGFRSQAKDK